MLPLTKKQQKIAKYSIVQVLRCVWNIKHPDNICIYQFGSQWVVMHSRYTFYQNVYVP